MIELREQTPGVHATGSNVWSNHLFSGQIVRRQLDTADLNLPQVFYSTVTAGLQNLYQRRSEVMHEQVILVVS